MKGGFFATYCFTDPPTPTLSDRALIGPASALPTDSRPTRPKTSPGLSAPRCPPQVAKSSHDLLTDPHKFDILHARPWQATVIETAVHLVFGARRLRGRSRGASHRPRMPCAVGVMYHAILRALWCFRQSSAKEGLTVEPHTSDSGPGSVTHSHDDRRDAAHEPNDTSRAGGGLDLREGELKAAVSVATAQLSQDLHAVGSQLSSIETGHRALMDRLHRIAEQADERALRQFGALQEQVTGDKLIFEPHKFCASSAGRRCTETNSERAGGP